MSTNLGYAIRATNKRKLTMITTFTHPVFGLMFRAIDAGETVDFHTRGAADWWIEMRVTVRESRARRNAR